MNLTWSDVGLRPGPQNYYCIMRFTRGREGVSERSEAPYKSLSIEFNILNNNKNNNMNMNLVWSNTVVYGASPRPRQYITILCIFLNNFSFKFF